MLTENVSVLCIFQSRREMKPTGRPCLKFQTSFTSYGRFRIHAPPPPPQEHATSGVNSSIGHAYEGWLKACCRYLPFNEKRLATDPVIHLSEHQSHEDTSDEVQGYPAVQQYPPPIGLHVSSGPAEQLPLSLEAGLAPRS